MSKELPFFKFFPTEWLTGNIVFESLELQGLFINICAIYWKKNGVLEFSEIDARYKKKALLAKLTDRFFLITDGFINIDFLDEQLSERQQVAENNSRNGSLGGRPSIEEKKANAKRTLSETKAKKSHKEKEKEEEKEEEKDKEIEQEIEKKLNVKNVYYEIFQDWFSGSFGFPFHMQKKDWIGISEIKKFCELNATSDPAESFKAILFKFDKLPPFYQQNRNPGFIGNKISEIVALIKKPTVTQTYSDNLMNIHSAVNGSKKEINKLNLLQ